MYFSSTFCNRCSGFFDSLDSCWIARVAVETKPTAISKPCLVLCFDSSSPHSSGSVEYGVVQLSQELCQPWSLSKPPLQVYSGIFSAQNEHGNHFLSSFCQIFLPGGDYYLPPPLTLLHPSPLNPFRGWRPPSSGWEFIKILRPWSKSENVATLMTVD